MAQSSSLSHMGGGYQANFLCSAISPIFHSYADTG